MFSSLRSLTGVDFDGFCTQEHGNPEQTLVCCSSCLRGFWSVICSIFTCPRETPVVNTCHRCQVVIALLFFFHGLSSSQRGHYLSKVTSPFSRVCAFLWRWWSVFGSSMARCEACSGPLLVSRLISGFVLREMLSLTGLTLHAQRKRATRAKHVLNLFALKASQTGARQMLLDSQVQLKYLKFEELCRDCHLQRHSHRFDAVRLLSG